MKLLLLFVAAVAAGPMDMMDMPMGNGDAGMGEAMGMPMPDDVMDMVGHVAMKMKMVKMLVSTCYQRLISFHHRCLFLVLL